MADGGPGHQGNDGHTGTLAQRSARAEPSRTAGPRLRLSRRLLPVAWTLVPVALFFCYMRVSQTYPSDSYGGVFTLQAWDMLHGNLLLHGWSLSDVSFYTTELPEYMLVELVLGPAADVVHVAGAITFTLLLVLVALLARGRARGKVAAIAVGVAAGIMCAPQRGGGVFLLLMAPDHLGTCVPVLLAWLILDRARARWYVPVAVGAVLAWALIADPLVLAIGVLPLVTVCGIRLYQALVRQRLPPRSWWLDASLIAAGLAAAGIARAALALTRASGGFYLHPVILAVTRIAALPHHLRLELEGISLLFGTGFFGQRLMWPAMLGLLHLAGLALAAWGTCVAVRRFNRGIGLVPQILVAAVLINLAGFLLWAPLGPGPTVVREVVAVLPLTAVLAGRLLAGRLTAARLQPALLAALIGYLAGLASVAAHPVQPPQYQQLTSWLTAHHLHDGLGWAPLTGEVTVSSGERVELLPVVASGRALVPGRWESDASWFDPRRHEASFVVLYGHPKRPSARAVQATLGPPERTYRFGPYTVLSWNENLLARLR